MGRGRGWRCCMFRSNMSPDPTTYLKAETGSDFIFKTGSATLRLRYFPPVWNLVVVTVSPFILLINKILHSDNPIDLESLAYGENNTSKVHIVTITNTTKIIRFFSFLTWLFYIVIYISMVFRLDGCSFHVAHAWRKMGLFG